MPLKCVPRPIFGPGYNKTIIRQIFTVYTSNMNTEPVHPPLSPWLLYLPWLTLQGLCMSCPWLHKKVMKLCPWFLAPFFKCFSSWVFYVLSTLKCIYWVVRCVYGMWARGYAFGLGCNQKSTTSQFKKEKTNHLWSFVESELNLWALFNIYNSMIFLNYGKLMEDVYMSNVCPYCVMNEFFCSVSGRMCKKVGKMFLK